MAEETEQNNESPVDLAHKAAQALKEQNERMEKNLERAEKLAATELLGGKSQAGQAPPEPKEETDAEYTKKVMSGEVPK